MIESQHLLFEFAGDICSASSYQEFPSPGQNINNEQRRPPTSSASELLSSDVSIDEVPWPLGDNCSVSSLSLQEMSRPASRTQEFLTPDPAINEQQHRPSSSSDKVFQQSDYDISCQ